MKISLSKYTIWIKSAADLIWPPVCAACRGAIDSRDETLSPFGHYCLKCLEEIEIIGPHCRLCGRPLIEGTPHICGECLKSPPLYAAAASAALHRGSVAKSISLLKYHGQLRQLKALATLALASSALESISSDIDILLPIPLSKARLAERGFNQAHELAKVIYKNAGMPKPDEKILLRLRDDGLHQASLTAAERKRAIKGHFKVNCNNGVIGANILLFDDVMTTGATLNEAAKALLDAGAKTVKVFTISRTPLWVWDLPGDAEEDF